MQIDAWNYRPVRIPSDICHGPFYGVAYTVESCGEIRRSWNENECEGSLFSPQIVTYRNNRV